MLKSRILARVQRWVKEIGVDDFAVALDVTRASVYYYLSQQRFPNPDRLDELYRISPENSLTKRIAQDILCAYPPVDCPPTPKPES